MPYAPLCGISTLSGSALRTEGGGEVSRTINGAWVGCGSPWGAGVVIASGWLAGSASIACSGADTGVCGRFSSSLSAGGLYLSPAVLPNY